MMTVNDFNIMAGILSDDDDKQGVIAIKGTTKKEIAEKTGLSVSKVGNTLAEFKKEGLVEYGLRRGNTYTYILTEKGFKEFLKVGGIMDND